MSPSTGILFNNQMDDFSTPNATNAFGLAPFSSNYPQSNKRPLSSMSPSIILRLCDATRGRWVAQYIVIPLFYHLVIIDHIQLLNMTGLAVLEAAIGSKYDSWAALQGVRASSLPLRR